MHLPYAEQPVLDGFQGVHLDEVGVVEQAGDAKLVLSLFKVLVVVGTVDRDHLEGVVRRVLAAADVQDGTVGPRAQRAEDLKLADAHARSTGDDSRKHERRDRHHHNSLPARPAVPVASVVVFVVSAGVVLVGESRTEAREV